MRTYPLECYYSVNNFVLAYGHIFDFGIKEKIINHWAKDSQNAEEKLMNEINELIYLIRRFLGFSDYKIKIEDCCALMAITLCNKFSSINSSIGELIWERLRENILNEWFQHISSSTGSDKCASNQLVLLTSALLDLESYCQAIKNRKDDYSGTVVEINNFTNIESKVGVE
uniref:NR LBD domain-containing protein n=1 Tax=Meloidogyne hapla TaxID=6305 RepID=A0A1I8B9A3_MELHA